MEAPKLTLGSRAAESVACAHCQKQIPAGEQFTFEEKKGQEISVCAACRETINQAYAAETQNPHYLGAVLGGLVAAILGGAIWYGVVIAIEKEIGYLALGVGYLIGWGVHFGARRKRGLPLQMIGVGLALVTFVVSEFFVVGYFAQKNLMALSDPSAQAASATIYQLMLQNIGLVAQDMVSPIGLFIWGLGLYMAFMVNKPRKV